MLSGSFSKNNLHEALTKLGQVMVTPEEIEALFKYMDPLFDLDPSNKDKV